MSKPCAYCGERRPPTREHIWPDWLLARTDYPIAYSGRAGKLVDRDQTVRDVCATCNNDHLGRLDGYALSLWDPYLKNWVAHGEEVELRYDHNLLLRWLLKLAYNASRTTGAHAGLLARYAKILISKDPVTPLFAFAKVATIKPNLLLDPQTGKFRLIQPRGARMGLGLLPNLPFDPSVATRLIQINAYRFSLLVMEDPDANVWKIKRRFDALPGVMLHPSGVTRIPAPAIDTLQAMEGVTRWAPAP